MRSHRAIAFALSITTFVMATVAAAEQGRPEMRESVFFVFFAAGRNEIPAAFNADIQEAACHGVPGVNVKVRGYTDAAGAAVDNLLLSQRRAVQVVNQMGRYGVSCDQLKDFKGMGEENPASNAENRPFSRRVEILVEGVLPTPDVVKMCVSGLMPIVAPPQCEKRP